MTSERIKELRDAWPRTEQGWTDVHECLDEIERLQAASAWRDASERPEEGRAYQAWMPDWPDDLIKATYSAGVWIDEESGCELAGVTHYRELPAPPEAKA